jgi:molybdate transport system ATP-binding protein
MKTQVLFVGVAVALMAAGGASARAKMAGGAYAAPSQPIPYSQLDAYVKASPKQRAAIVASNGAAASTGTAANTSAATMTNAETPAAAEPTGTTKGGMLSGSTTDTGSGAPVNPSPPASATTPATAPN